jgi:tRNA (guanine-N7-)-methyltransferase
VPDHDQQQTERAFFGRRKGHPLRNRQEQLFRTELPRLQIDLSRPLTSLTSLFDKPVDEVRLEIGFGGGEHLIAQAQAHPRVGFIGCDAFVNGVARLVGEVTDRGLSNVRVHFGDAAELLAWLSPHSLAQIDLLYPDPWPKRRHCKRRLIQSERIDELARVLRADGQFRFASDWPDYVAWTLALFMRSDLFAWTAECADDWRKPWPGYVRTRYEAKALREGRIPAYLNFMRLGAEGLRPGRSAGPATCHIRPE